MKTAFYNTLLICLFAFSGIFSGETISDTATKETFPQEISFDKNGHHYLLRATGVATRKKLIIKVYSIASYLQKDALKPGVTTLEAILSDDYAKQLTIKWVRSVNLDQIKDSYQEAFHKVFPDTAYERVRGQINKFLGFFTSGANKGETLNFRWIPGGIVEVFNNNEEIGTITNKEFALGLWNIWFGEKSVVDRNSLLSLK